MEWLKTFPIALMTSLAFLGWAALSALSLPSESEGLGHFMRTWAASFLRSRDLHRGAAGGAAFGAIVGSLAVLAASSHDPQAEFATADSMAAGPLVVIWLSWFLIAVVGIAPWIALVSVAIRRASRRPPAR